MTKRSAEFRESPELEDLKSLATALAAVPLTWLIFLGWSPRFSIMSHDALAFTLPVATALFREGASFADFAYSPLAFGGAQLHSAVGTLPLLEYLGKLGLGPVAALNGVVFGFQILYAFLGARIAGDLGQLFKGSELAPVSRGSAWGTRLGLVWLLAFTPALGWKIFYGHQTLALGGLALIAGASLALSARLGRLTRTQLGVAATALVLSLTAMGQQTVVYGAIFGAPILIAFLFDGRWRQTARAALLPVLVLLAAVAIAWPRLGPMVRYALGDDASRSLTGETVTYSYIQATLWDWVSCLPWAKSLIATGRDAFLDHETNYPFGPLLLGLALIPWRRFRGIALALALVALVPMGFAMHTAPISAIWLAVFPILRSFRVPERAVLSFVLLLPVFVAGAWMALATGGVKMNPRAGGRSKAGSGSGDLGMLAGSAGAGLLLFSFPAELRELLVWLLMGGVVAAYFLRRRLALPPAALLLVFGMASVSAFSERKLPYTDFAEIPAAVDRMRQTAIAQEPSLANPLNRARLDANLGGASANFNLSLGISTIDGYGAPLRRYVELFSALEGHPFNPTANFLQLALYPSFGILRPLYNVGFLVQGDGNQTRVSRVGPTAGAAWFSRSLARVDSYPALAAKLRGLGGNLSERVREEAWLVAGDPKAANVAPLAANVACATAEVRSTQVESHGSRIRVGVQTAVPCPLTIATNFSSDFVAQAQVGGAAQTLAVYPSFGALTGVVVPAGAQEVVVEMKPLVSPAATIIAVLGALLLIGAMVLLPRYANLGRTLTAYSKDSPPPARP